MVTIYILVNDVPKALDFYKRAFGAIELHRLEIKPGQIAHAEFKIGNSVIMISGATPQMKLPPNSGDSRYVCFMETVQGRLKIHLDIFGLSARISRGRLK